MPFLKSTQLAMRNAKLMKFSVSLVEFCSKDFISVGICPFFILSASPLLDWVEC